MENWNDSVILMDIYFMIVPMAYTKKKKDGEAHLSFIKKSTEKNRLKFRKTFLKIIENRKTSFYLQIDFLL